MSWLAFWRQDADFTVQSFDKIPFADALGRHHYLAVAQSSAGPAQNGTTEDSHVKIFLFDDSRRWIMTDLRLGAEGKVEVKVTDLREPGGLNTNNGIIRGWSLGWGSAGQGRFQKAQAKACALRATIDGSRYEKYSLNTANLFGNQKVVSWNCAKYAEKILTAAGLNVSGGLFVSSPLELTTGHSVLVRTMLNDCNKDKSEPWYLSRTKKL